MDAGVESIAQADILEVKTLLAAALWRRRSCWRGRRGNGVGVEVVLVPIVLDRGECDVDGACTVVDGSITLPGVARPVLEGISTGVKVVPLPLE